MNTTSANSATLDSPSARVYPFPRSRAVRALNTLPSPVETASWLASQDWAAYIESIEGAVAALTARSNLLAALSSRNPFDAVYISALGPDDLDRNAMARIQAFAEIEDKSHEIGFDDGLDD